MELLLHNISQVLGITVIHSLWQGLLVYLVLQIVLSCVPSLSSAKKHHLGMAALVAVAGWFVFTLFAEVNRMSWFAVQTAENIARVNFLPHTFTHTVPQTTDTYLDIVKQYLPYITVVYLIGLLLNVLKLCFAWRNITLLKRMLTTADRLQADAKKYALHLGIKKHVAVRYSNMVDVPGMIGYIKPIILLPVSIATSLSAAEIEAIVLHEMVHIKRNDYLFNLLQQVIGVLLFFNPFALLINRIINTEREKSCDDEVVNVTGQPLIYAQALLKLERCKPNNLQLALAATGKKYVLLNRIERIMTTQKLTANIRHIAAAIVLFTLSLGSIAWLNPEIKNNRIVLNPPAVAARLFADTVPEKVSKETKKNVVKHTVKTADGKTMVYGYDDDDPKLEALSAEVEKHAREVEKYYDSPEFKKMSEDMEKAGAKIEAYYNSPAIKKLLEQQEKFSAQFEEKWSDNPEMKKLQSELENLSKGIESYYTSPEYLKLEKKLESESRLLDKAKPNSAEAKKHIENIRITSKAIGEYVHSPEMLQQRNMLNEMNDKIRGYYQSEDFKQGQVKLRAMSDSLRKIHNNDRVKAQQNILRELGEKMRNFQHDAKLKLHQQQLAEASKKLRAYTQSPEFKKRMQLQKELVNKQFELMPDFPLDPPVPALETDVITPPAAPADVPAPADVEVN